MRIEEYFVFREFQNARRWLDRFWESWKMEFFWNWEGIVRFLLNCCDFFGNMRFLNEWRDFMIFRKIGFFLETISFQFYFHFIFFWKFSYFDFYALFTFSLSFLNNTLKSSHMRLLRLNLRECTWFAGLFIILVDSKKPSQILLFNLLFK